MTPPTPHAISLVLHQDDKPGWRIHLNPNGVDGGYPVSIKEAEELARTATDILSASIPVTDDKGVTPFQIVRNGTTALRATLEGELSDAEAKAANIATLRRTLAEMTE
jgi:hypothetical protein